MKKTTSLLRFHNGVTFGPPTLTIPWHINQETFLDVVPRHLITSVNSNWICVALTLFGVDDIYGFNFIAHPDPLFHEVQVYDQEPNSLARKFQVFADAARHSIGEPTMEFKTHLRWHDRFIILDLCISDVRDEADGPSFPRFMLSLQNSTRYTPHWNNQPTRRPGLE